MRTDWQMLWTNCTGMSHPQQHSQKARQHLIHTIFLWCTKAFLILPLRSQTTMSYPSPAMYAPHAEARTDLFTLGNTLLAEHLDVATRAFQVGRCYSEFDALHCSSNAQHTPPYTQA